MKYINADDVYYGMRKHEFEAKYITIGEFVDHLPSADVVEVVRCKDCKYFKPHINIGYCDKAIALLGELNPDNYCSYGERKETE